MSDYNSSFTAEQIENKLQGLIVYNDAQTLTDAQKAQARANIGAGTSSSGLQITGYFDTYDELAAAVTNPKTGSTYAVGTQAPYNIYIWDSLNMAWVSNGNIRGADGSDANVTAENISLALGYTPLSNAASAVKSANLENSAVGTEKLANASVTAAKIAYGALVTVVNFRLITGATWTQNTYGTYTGVVTVTGADPAKHKAFLYNRRQAAVPGDSDWGFNLSGLEADEEALANIFSARITAVNTLTLVAKEMPARDLYLALELIHI